MAYNKTRRARTELIVALVLILFVVSVPLIRAARARQEADRTQAALVAYGSTVSQRHGVGESFELIGEEGSQKMGSASWSYLDSLDWTGRMRLRVMDARLFDSPAAAGLAPLESQHPISKEQADEQLAGEAIVVVALEMENVDAEMPEDNGRGHSWSNIGNVVNLKSNDRDSGLADSTWFDGTPEGATEPEYYSYEVPKGAVRTYHLGYEVSKEDMGNPMELHFGSNETYGSCVVDLGVIGHG